MRSKRKGLALPVCEVLERHREDLEVLDNDLERRRSAELRRKRLAIENEQKKALPGRTPGRAGRASRGVRPPRIIRKHPNSVREEYVITQTPFSQEITPVYEKMADLLNSWEGGRAPRTLYEFCTTIQYLLSVDPTAVQSVPGYAEAVRRSGGDEAGMRNAIHENALSVWLRIQQIAKEREEENADRLIDQRDQVLAFNRCVMLDWLMRSLTDQKWREMIPPIVLEHDKSFSPRAHREPFEKDLRGKMFDLPLERMKGATHDKLESLLINHSLNGKFSLNPLELRPQGLNWHIDSLQKALGREGALRILRNAPYILDSTDNVSALIGLIQEDMHERSGNSLSLIELGKRNVHDPVIAAYNHYHEESGRGRVPLKITPDMSPSRVLVPLIPPEPRPAISETPIASSEPEQGNAQENGALRAVLLDRFPELSRAIDEQMIPALRAQESALLDRATAGDMEATLDFLAEWGFCFGEVKADPGHFCEILRQMVSAREKREG